MVTRFTRHVRSTVGAAEVEARTSGSPAVEAEHLLLAISARAGTEGYRVLTAAGLDHASITAALERETEQSLRAAGVVLESGRLPQATVDRSRHLRLAASAKAAIERAARAADGATQIRSGHLLVGVLGAQAGTVPRMLVLAGVDRGGLIEQATAATGVDEE